MTSVIDLRPQKVDLKMYAGDGRSIRLTFTQNGEPFPMDGVISAQIKKLKTDTVSLVDFSVDMTDANPNGVVFISYTGDDSKDLMDHDSVRNGRFSGVWDVQWEPDGSDPRTILQGKVECVGDVTR